jgi:hypothetical protein
MYKSIKGDKFMVSIRRKQYKLIKWMSLEGALYCQKIIIIDLNNNNENVVAIINQQFEKRKDYLLRLHP